MHITSSAGIRTKSTDSRAVLRLLPPVPVNFRVANKNTSLPVGGGANGHSPIYIKKNTMVAYSVYAMHRRTDLWGQDAHQFRPERWEENAKRGWEYLPFNGGPRICLGRKYHPRDLLSSFISRRDACMTRLLMVDSH